MPEEFETLPGWMAEQNRYDNTTLSRSNLRQIIEQIKEADTREIEHCQRFLVEIRNLIDQRLKEVNSE